MAPFTPKRRPPSPREMVPFSPKGKEMPSFPPFIPTTFPHLTGREYRSFGTVSHSRQNCTRLRHRRIDKTGGKWMLLVWSLFFPLFPPYCSSSSHHLSAFFLPTFFLPLFSLPFSSFQVLDSPHIFVFGELLDSPAIQEMSDSPTHSPYLQLLRSHAPRRCLPLLP